MPDPATIVGWLVALATSGGLGFWLATRWMDRPKVRIHIRWDGLGFDDELLEFEVSNGGGRATSLHPEVRLRGYASNLTVRRWYPDFLDRLFSRDEVERLDLNLVVPSSGITGKVDEWYVLQGKGDALRLEPHCGARPMVASPRRPDRLHARILFRSFEFGLEGRRRRIKVRAPYNTQRPWPAWRFHLARLAFVWFGKFPGGEVPRDFPDHLARRKARG